MRIITTASLLILSTIATAQITLTETDFGNSNDTVRISVSNDFMIDYVSTGAGYNWDFSQLTPNSQFLKDYRPIIEAGFGYFLFGPAASQAYEASYFSESTALPLDQLGQLLPINITGFFSVTKVAADAVTTVGSIIGIEDNLISVKADTIETRYQLPLNFGDTYSSVGHTNLNFDPFYAGAWIQHRERSSEVDGYGQITTPYGTFEAIRVKHEIDEYDSLLVDFNGNSVWLPLPVPLTREYEWWTNGEKEPVLKVVTNDFFGTEVVTAVEYRDIYRGLDASLDEIPLNIVMGPNPAEDKLTISSDQPIKKIVLIQSDGKMAMQMNVLGSFQQELELDGAMSGLYFVEVHCGERVSRQPLVVR